MKSLVLSHRHPLGCFYSEFLEMSAMILMLDNAVCIIQCLQRIDLFPIYLQQPALDIRGIYQIIMQTYVTVSHTHMLAYVSKHMSV